MKKLSIILLILIISTLANAQRKTTDSLYKVLKYAQTDTVKQDVLLKLSKYYYLAYPDSGIVTAQQAYELADKHNWVSPKAISLNSIANAYSILGDYAMAIQYYIKALKIFESINDQFGIAKINNNIGATYVQKVDYKSALPYLRLAQQQLNTYTVSHPSTPTITDLKTIVVLNIGECLFYVNKIDSADHYLNLCYLEAKKYSAQGVLGEIECDLGLVQAAKNNKAAALAYYRKAVLASKSEDDVEDLTITYLSTAKLYHKYKQQDSAEYYAKKAIETAVAGKFEQDVLNAGQALYGYYDEDHNLPEAYKYFKLTTAAKDSLYSQDKVKQLLSLDFDERQRREDLAAAQIQYQNQVRTYLFIAGLVILLFIVFVFWRNGLQRKNANTLLRQQKSDIEATLAKLQQTQTQLIQSEKMASLGELTAGIAHEIQNPLNFVNNFSEVNREMIDELEAELKTGNVDEALAIAADIKQNEEKINRHGRRADFIVKGMLQHSRTNTGERQLTNINVLADEFLKLSYHGLRAKNKNFNAELVTNFDESLPKMNVVSQDIGRVLLNLFNNAFYAVNQKIKTTGDDYKPTVTVTTFAPATGGRGIKVKDNGNGIPDAIKDKIMQPFFTTKPTGEGTGLGLSLSYDIVYKGHNGSINITSTEGIGSEFIIILPIS